MIRRRSGVIGLRCPRHHLRHRRRDETLGDRKSQFGILCVHNGCTEIVVSRVI
jgi:hypothetical protein